MMRAGRLRHRLRIQRLTETVNAVGGVTRSWTTIAVRWGGVEPLSGREQINADQTNAVVSHRIMLRAGGLSITPKDRILHGERAFGITQVIDRDERGAVLEILATEDGDP